MAERILPTEAQAPAPATHPYNDPDLSPIEFLTAVYRDPHLPMVSRIQAASALLPYTNSVPRPTAPPAYTIVIPPLSYEPWSEVCSPWPRSTGNHSQNLVSPNTTLTHGADPQAPVNIEENPEPPPFIPDYSTPPTIQELAEIQAAISRLRPDLAHLPPPDLHLCPCGHWIAGDCDCSRFPRDPSKMN
jgi:hypothetical protein